MLLLLLLLDGAGFRAFAESDTARVAHEREGPQSRRRAHARRNRAIRQQRSHAAIRL